MIEGALAISSYFDCGQYLGYLQQNDGGFYFIVFIFKQWTAILAVQPTIEYHLAVFD